VIRRSGSSRGWFYDFTTHCSPSRHSILRVWMLSIADGRLERIHPFAIQRGKAMAHNPSRKTCIILLLHGRLVGLSVCIGVCLVLRRQSVSIPTVRHRRCHLDKKTGTREENGTGAINCSPFPAVIPPLHAPHRTQTFLIYNCGFQQTTRCPECNHPIPTPQNPPPRRLLRRRILLRNPSPLRCAFGTTFAQPPPEEK